MHGQIQAAGVAGMFYPAQADACANMVDSFLAAARRVPVAPKAVIAPHAGFAYSEAMTGHRAVEPAWTLDALDQFITAPQRHVPGTKMSFAGLPKPEDRANVIAYLAANP